MTCLVLTLLTAPLPSPALEVAVAINHTRVSQGLLPLKINRDMTNAAQWYAEDLAARQTSRAHIDSTGRDPFQRMRDFGVPAYEFAAENACAGFKSPADALDGWMRSRGHRRNILTTEAREIGVGSASRGRPSYVALFAGLRHCYPVVINCDEPATRETVVSLAIHGEGRFSQLRLSADGFSWTAWRPFQSDVEFALDFAPGLKRVYVEMRHGRETRRESDEIELIR
jgi:hypothetical protein